MTVFDIPLARLSELDDDDFKELIARLCEDEVERQGGNRLEVRWAGHRKAKDGGLDVVVETGDCFTRPNRLLPRKYTGLQVKTEKFEPRKIEKEMIKKGNLRSSISKLAEEEGAYLIVSSKDNCTNKMLKDRREAMQKAVAGDQNAASIQLDFGSNHDVSRWVSTHPRVAIWLRERLALPCLEGWKQFGRWSGTPRSEDDTLICGKGLQFQFKDGPAITNLIEAVDKIRELVKTGDAAVRIVGHSGIGKTRIVQALFESIGKTQKLPCFQAVYTDLDQPLSTSPMQMLEALNLPNVSAILIIDNCPPDTHRLLVKQLGATNSKVRLVTVEYDVKTDQPEQTDVVTIKTKGTDIVNRLLARRRPDLSSQDVDRLAGLALGNARLGLALANFAPEDGPLSAFDDTELFKRLFWQRNAHDPELDKAAQVLSLVYSFDLEGEEDPGELAVLSSLIGQDAVSLRWHAVTLQKRDLIQARGGWRAILPQALADRLAREALDFIPWQDVASTFADKPRLLGSFARRISHLHDVKPVRKVIRNWMEPCGPLEDPTAKMKLVKLVSHHVNDDLLKFVEKWINTEDQPDQRLGLIDDLVRITELTAHEEKFFSRACHTLVVLALRHNPMNELIGKIREDEAIDNLFRLLSSGTLAQTDVRISVASDTIKSSDQQKVLIGLKMLASALKVGHTSYNVTFIEDTQHSTLCWEPRSEEIVDWFYKWIRLAVDVANSGNHVAEEESRNALATQLSDIWRYIPPLRSLLIESIRKINEKRQWPDALRRLNHILRLVQSFGDGSPEEDIKAVEDLIEEMSPSELAARVYSELGADVNYDRREKRLNRLGRELANSPDVLRSVLPAVLRSGSYGMGSLGKGIAEATDDPTALWPLLREAYLNEPVSERNISVLGAFVRHLDKYDPEVAELIRQECRKSDHLRRDYGFFLPNSALSPEETERVIEYAADAEVCGKQLIDIIWRKEFCLSDVTRVRLMRSLLSRSEGPKLVVEALVMLQGAEKDNHRVWPEDIRRIGLDAIETLIFRNGVDGTLESQMGELTLYCLENDEGSGVARLLSALSDQAARHDDSVRHLSSTAGAIATVAPSAYLNSVAPDPDSGLRGFGLHDARFGFWPLSMVPPEALVDWCSENDARWTRIVPYLELFTLDQGGVSEHNMEEKLSCQIVAILEAAPEPGSVLDLLFDRITMRSCDIGSLAATVERRLRIFEQLNGQLRPEVRTAVSRREPSIRKWVTEERRREADEEAVRSQRFE